MIEGDDLFEKYNAIWDNVCTDIKKEFDGELVYNKEFLKIKTKFHCDEVTVKRNPKLNSVLG